MRLWPEKQWKKILLISLIIVVLIMASLGIFVLFKANSDVASEIDVLNPNGSGVALVIYHPGISSFSRDAVYSFADGLVDNNWRVEITTASDQAPTDLSKYSLLVLSSPVYGGSPSPSIERHVKRMGDLEGIETALVVTSGGSNGAAEESMQRTVEEHQGEIKTVLSLYSGNSLDLAVQAGREIYPKDTN